MSSTNPVLEIHPGIVLKGQLSMAKDIILTGTFEGDLQTLGRLTVSAGGVAVGTIEAGSLVLEPGNLVEARVKITSSVTKAPASVPKPGKSSKWPLSFKKLKDLALGRK